MLKTHLVLLQELVVVALIVPQLCVLHLCKVWQGSRSGGSAPPRPFRSQPGWLQGLPARSKQERSQPN